MPEERSWGLVAGDPITAELTAARRLGGGATYEAWLAFDATTHGPVVVKVLRPRWAGTERGLRRIRREAAALDLVRHPRIVRALRADLDSERPHLVLEHLEGPRLKDVVEQQGALGPQQYLPLAIDLASAVHYLGGVGLVHLDVKPSNVVMGARAHLIDLSIARREEVAGRLTRPVGTGAWMSPEQCRAGVDGAPGPGPEADVWGLGVTLHHAVSGVRPFPSGDRDGTGSTRHPQLVAEPAPLPDGTHPVVVAVVASMLERRPGDRPRPVEVADALQPLLEELPATRLRR